MFAEQHQIEQDTLSGKAQSALWKQAESCKRALVDGREGTMSLMLEEGVKELHVDRAKFDQAAKPLLARLQNRSSVHCAMLQSNSMSWMR